MVSPARANGGTEPVTVTTAQLRLRTSSASRRTPKLTIRLAIALRSMAEFEESPRPARPVIRPTPMSWFCRRPWMLPISLILTEGTATPWAAAASHNTPASIAARAAAAALLHELFNEHLSCRHHGALKAP